MFKALFVVFLVYLLYRWVVLPKLPSSDDRPELNRFEKPKQESGGSEEEYIDYEEVD